MCGSASKSAGYCATAGEYCQPWDPTYYQCQPAPLLCGAHQINIDFHGVDSSTIYGAKPLECYVKCADTMDRKAYTSMNEGTPTCYLKNGRKITVDAVSEIVN